MNGSAPQPDFRLTLPCRSGALDWWEVLVDLIGVALAGLTWEDLEISLAFVIKGARFLPMIFVESTAFSRKVYEVLSDAELMALERLLLVKPDSGDLIQGSKGLRKIRVASGGKGKRGGSRVVYYWYVTPEKIQLCRIYEKSSQANLSQTEIDQILTELDS